MTSASAHQHVRRADPDADDRPAGRRTGLRYTQFHTTALCSPTRAALLTGRNHHTAATGVIMEVGTGFPGYNTLMPKSCGTFAEVLRQNGYNTAWYGKNHNVPDWHTSQAGPFDLWPTGLGFEYFYGFIGGDTNQWAPAIFENTKPIEPPHDAKDYFFDKDMADKAIDWIRLLHAVAPDKPFFVYYAPGTAHAPHHAPKEWIAKFKGQFDQGWDKVREETLARQKQLGIVPQDTKLTPRSDGHPGLGLARCRPEESLRAHDGGLCRGAFATATTRWAASSTRSRRWASSTTRWSSTSRATTARAPKAARRACSTRWRSSTPRPRTSRTCCARMDELGGPTTFNHYPIGWAHAMDTPFQWTKQVASHFGGTRNGLVISWPARIKDKGGIRSQFHHVIDIAPTILEAVGCHSRRRCSTACRRSRSRA